jgi:acetyl esterase/lipase
MKWFWSTLRILGWTGVAAAGLRLGLVESRTAGIMAGNATVIVVRDRNYRVDGTRQARIDVYLPQPQPLLEVAGVPPRRPGMLVIHGGSWIGGSKSEYGPQFARLTEHGYVVFAADYKLARPGDPGWPDALDDLREAVRWIRSHAEEFQVDPNRLTALGSGAGGHLAALLGTLPPESGPGEASARVQAVVGLYGPSDLADLVHRRSLANDPVNAFLGDSPGENMARATAASPINHVTAGDSPMLLIHGSDDAWVHLEQSKRLADALAGVRVRHRLIVVPGARHGFELMVGFPEPRDLLPDVLAFLETVWRFHPDDQP